MAALGFGRSGSMLAAVLVGALTIVGVRVLMNGATDHFPQVAYERAHPAASVLDAAQTAAYGRWVVTFQRSYARSAWYRMVSGSRLVPQDDSLAITMTVAPDASGKQTALRACSAAADAQELASMRFLGGIVVYGTATGKLSPLAALGPIACYG